MQKITPFLWFDDNAEEAVAFYTSIFEKSRTVSVSRYPTPAEGGGRREGRRRVSRNRRAPATASRGLLLAGPGGRREGRIMRTNTFGRIPFNTDNRTLPVVPREEPARQPHSVSLRLHPTLPFSSRRDGSGPAFLQRLRIRRIP